MIMLSVIGRSLARDGQPEEGLASFEDMLQRIARANPPLSPGLIYTTRRFYPLALRDVGRVEDGLAAGRENIRMAEAAYGPKSVERASAQDYHARECEKAERWQEAHDQWQSSLENYLTAYGPSNTRSRGASDGIIEMKLKLGHPDEAIAARRRFIGLLESAAGPRALETTKQAKLLIADLLSINRHAEAKTEVMQWLAKFKKTNGVFPISAEPILNAAVDVYLKHEEWRTALDTQREAITIKKSYAADFWAIDQAKCVEGFCLSKLNRSGEAVALLQEGIAGLETKKNQDPAIEREWLPLARERLKAAEAQVR
ncbi:MAG: hypothetical protein IPK22_21360 [Verrucomicrobiaceae bacterium]|nr:hypothetical protein [Verrucomicrobiaceae bacterium]